MNEWMNVYIDLYSTNWIESSEALAAEEMTFESLCKCLDGHTWSQQFDGEAVPRGRAQRGKVSQTDHSPCTRHDECPAVSRLQLPPANDGRNGDTHVSQVGWCQTVKAFEGDG